MHEHGLQRPQVLAGIELAFLVHVGQRMQGLIDIAGCRILAIEYREVLNVMRLGTILATEPDHRLAEIHDPVIGRRARTDEVNDSQRGVFFEQHRDRAGALRRLATGAARILGNIGTDDDRLAAGTVQRKMANCTLHAVNTAQASMLEFRNFTAARNRRHAPRLERLVDHALDDNGAGRIVGARLGAETQELDARRIDVVLVDQAHDGGGRHRVNAVIGPAYPETAADDFADLGPVIAGPLAPVLEPHAIRRHVGSEAGDPDGFPG